MIKINTVAKFLVKQNFLSVFFCSIIIPINSMAQIGIGINTESPQKIFHIDGQRNTTGSTNIIDDVVIDNTGKVGVGVVSPASKLHLYTPNRATTPAFRLQDGTQGIDKILKSDSDGRAFWADQASSFSTKYNLTGSTVTRYVQQAMTLLKAIPISETGNYLITIRWWGVTSAVDTNGLTSAYFYLNEGATATAGGDTRKDGIEYYVWAQAVGRVFSFTTSLFSSATAGRYLKVYINVAVPTASPGFYWEIGTVSPTNTNWNPSITVFKI